MNNLAIPDFGNHEVWEAMESYAIYYDRSHDEANKLFLSTIMVGSSLRTLAESNPERRLGIILGYRGRYNHKLIGRSISFFDGPAAFLTWGMDYEHRYNVAMRSIYEITKSHRMGGKYFPAIYATLWIEAEPDGRVSRHLSFADKGQSVVKELFFSFYTKAGKLYHAMFFENPRHASESGASA